MTSSDSNRSVFVPLIAIILGTFMVILDNTVVNVALPTLGRVFDSDLSLLQWVISGYMLAQAAVIPLSGWLSDRYGAKRVYLISVVMFTAGSALCGMAMSAEMLVATRVLQGLGGGMLMPIGMAVLYRLTPPERRGAIFGLFGIPLMVAPALGPVLSGYLLQYADWRLIFLINLPVGILALVFGLRALPSIPAGRTVGALDRLGIVLGPLAFAAISFGVSQSTVGGWTSVPTLGGIIIGSVALILFVWRELTVSDPILELRVFRSREFTIAIITQWTVFAGMFGTFFLVPLFLQQFRGYGAFETGIFTLPSAVSSAVFMQIGGRAFDRVGVKPPVLLGMSLMAISLWMLTGLDAQTSGLDLFVPMTLLGAGLGSMMMALNTHLLNSAPRELIGRVTSLTNALQNVVSSLAIATFATLLEVRIPAHFSPAEAFGDVYRVAAALLAVGWILVWALRRNPPAQVRELQPANIELAA